MGENLPQQYKRVVQMQGSAAARARLPRQISHFIDNEQRVIYVVLWSDLNSFRYSNPSEIWANKRLKNGVITDFNNFEFQSCPN